MLKLGYLVAVTAVAVGCAHQPPMLEGAAAPLVQPSAGKALVVFARPARWPAYAPAVMDDSGTVLGTLRGGAYFSVEVDPGTHDFVVFLDDAQLVRADCAAGKVYVVEVFGTPGVMNARFDATVWTGEDRFELHRELSQLAPVVVGRAERRDDSQEWFRRANERFAELSSDALRAHVLSPDDGFDAL